MMSSRRSARLAARTETRIRTLDALMAPPKERVVLRKMFHMLKDMPHLWNRRHRDYKSVHKVTELHALLKAYWEFDPYATVCVVRRKLETFIKLYVKEWQRVKLCRLFYPDEPHKYEPTMWHFSDFAFMSSSIAIDWPSASELRPTRLEVRQAAVAKLAIKGGENDTKKDADNPPSPSSSTSSEDTAPTVYLKYNADAVYEPWRVHNKEKDAKEDIQMFVDSHLEGVDKEQKDIALKLISETLQHASAGKLTAGSCVQLEPNKDKAQEI